MRSGWDWVLGSNSSRPARPHHHFTEDGRRVREVLSYSRRGSRLTEKQAQAWVASADRWVIPEESADTSRVEDWFDRTAPLIVEIGSGIGEAAVATALAYPDHNALAFEVWRPGVADTLIRIEQAEVTNLRLIELDAVWSLRHLFEEGSLAQVHTWFPDPWHKARHHKRRLVGPDFAHTVASRLAPGGVWRLATDWAQYAEHMLEVLDAEPLLAGGACERWGTRPLTKFERKGINVGREICDLAYVRTS